MWKNLHAAVMAAGVLLAGLVAFSPTPAQAWWVGPRVVVVPPAYYAPRYYAPPPVAVYAPPPPYYAYGPRHGRVWVHGHWRGGY